VVDAQQARLITVNEAEGTGSRKGGEGGGDAAGEAALRVLGQMIIEEAGFAVPGAAEEPVGDHHLPNGGALDGVGGPEPGDVLG
jgi:hypothetical protein